MVHCPCSEYPCSLEGLLDIYFHLQEVGVEIAEAVSIILAFGPICSSLEVAHVILWLVENAAIASQGN